jgi:UDP-3-O-acyl N-acetylglucosamine deacetylase
VTAPVREQRQHTLRRSIALSGVGLHSGTPVTIECHPSRGDSGISFMRADLPDAKPIVARTRTVGDVRRGVTLGGPDGVRTVEHLLAAAAGLAIDNLRVNVHGPELPALDGSAAPYCDAFERAGLDEQATRVEPVSLTTPIWVQRGTAWILGVPAAQFRITYVVPLPSEALGIQVADVEVDRARFLREIAPARTWGFVEELRALRAEGLALGANEDNALGIAPDGYTGRPRFPDEPARHKALDLIGDLALLGRPLQAHVIAFAAGHSLHIELVRAIEHSTNG